MATTVTGHTGWGGPYNNFRLGGHITRTAVNVANNTSTVNFGFWLESVPSGSFTGLWTVRDLWFDGYQLAVWGDNVTLGGGSSVGVSNDTRTITHNSDGTRSVGAGIVVSNSFIGSFHLDITLVLDTIPRATVPSWSGNFEAGTAKTISLPRASSGFTHDVQYSFGSSGWQTIATGAGVTTSWTPPLSLLEHIPNATSGTGTIRVTTKQSGTTIGVAQSKPFTLTAPSSVVPTVSTVVWDDQNPVIKTNIGAFVQGLSLIKGTVTAAGVHGSTITEKRLRVSGTQVAETTPIRVDGAGTVTAQGEAVDSRGRLGTKAANFTVLAYEPPRLGANGWQVRRANSAGVPTDDGQYLRLDLHAIAASLKPASTEKNALTITVKTRPVEGSWTTRNVITPGLTYNTNVLITGDGTYLVAQSYEVEITLADKTGIEPTRLLTVVTPAVVTVDLDGTRMGVGGYRTRGALELWGGDGYAPNWRADENIYAGGAVLDPIGSGKLWFTDTPPAGWLLCQGQAVSRTTYAALFALIGTTYGAGNGSTTFNLPDLRGRVPVGKSSDTEFDALGKTFGTKTHTLTIAEMPSHTHTETNSTNSAVAGWYAPGGGVYNVATNVEYTKNSGSAGGGGAHNNVQPSIAVNYIIRAL